MDNKLSELKAAAMAATPGPWIKIDYFWIGRAGAINSEFVTCDNGPDADYIKRVSPDVVLALLADNEHLARELVARNGENEWLRKRATELEAKAMEGRCIEQERELFRVERTAHQQHAQELEKRIAELEAIRADAAQVFKEIGNELGCNPDNESIMMAIDALKERLATPVRLPRPACTYADHSYPAYSRAQVEEIITTAGMRVTVEGDEQ